MIDSQRGAIIISYPTSASGIVLLKMPPKYRKLDRNKNKNKKAQKIMHMLAVFVVDHGIMAHNP